MNLDPSHMVCQSTRPRAGPPTCDKAGRLRASSALRPPPGGELEMVTAARHTPGVCACTCPNTSQEFTRIWS